MAAPPLPETGRNDPAGDQVCAETQVTQLLQNWREGDDGALEKLTPLVYDELRRIARHHLGGAAANHTLQTTGLVHEAYLRLAQQSSPTYQNRAHFMAVAARAMWQILVDYALRQGRQKRGGGAQKIELDETALLCATQSEEVIELNEALDRLGRIDARKAQVVELRYFGGLNQDEIAEVLKVSAITVQRDWTFAKAWLYHELKPAA